MAHRAEIGANISAAGDMRGSALTNHADDSITPDNEASGNVPLSDMHCHLDFTSDGAAIAREAGWPMLSMTVHPRTYRSACEAFAALPNVVVAAGLHPWWIADGTCSSEDVNLAVELARESRFVGEVGLDFSKRFTGSEQMQVEAFDAIVAACAEEGGKVLSIHALNSADAVLDVLERHEAMRTCTCILHWFSGSSQQLQRAIAMGCAFSLNDRMLATGRGREYAKVMPSDRILLETDLPGRQGEPCSAQAMRQSLESTLDALELARRKPCAREIASNVERILR